jgi:hypothetical protein
VNWDDPKKVWDFHKKAFDIIFDSMKKQVEGERRKVPRPPSHKEWAEHQEKKPE